MLGNTLSASAPPAWRLSGAVAALALSDHYMAGADSIREHCYHVIHGCVNAAQRKFARDQLVKPCGPWCDADRAIADALEWSVAFRRAIESRAQALVQAGKLTSADIPVAYAAAVEVLTKAAVDFDSVHIAHSVCHMLMDHCAPNPVRH